jgi:RNA polymerase sigma-70 factor (ECF subfamily)
MCHLYEQREVLGTVSDLAPWLSRVLYHRFVDGDRARQRRPLTLVGDDNAALDRAAALEDVNAEDDPATLAGAREDAERLQRALARLREHHRILVLMHDAEGYTLTEIEAMTDIPVGTLKSRLSRARARLREFLWDSSDLPGQSPNSQETVQKKMEPFSSSQRVGR